MCQRKSGVAVLIGEKVKVFTLEGEDSHTAIREKLNLRDDLSPSAARTTPIELISVKSLTELSGMEFRFDAEKPDWWTDDMTEEATRQLFQAMKRDWKGKVLKYCGNLYLSSLQQVPEGVTIEAGGNLDLSSLEQVPEDVTLKAGYSLDLRSLKQVPEGVKVKAEHVFLKD